MSKSRILIAVIVLGLIAAIVVGALLVKDLASQSQELEAILIVENGIVSYRESEDSEYEQIQQEQITIASGSYIKTADQSFARVYFPDNSLVSLDANTEIQLEFAAEDRSIDQLLGKTWHRVQNVLNGGSYEVSTPNAIAAIRGTSFSVSFDGVDVTDIEVTESNVEVSGRDTEQPEEMIDTQNVGAGMWIQVTGLRAGEIEVMLTETTDERKEKFWFVRNNAFGTQYDRLISEYSGNDFREKLQEEIDTNQDLLDLDLGYGKINPDDAKEELDDVFELLQITEDSCEIYSQEQIQNAVIKVDRYKRFIANGEELKQILESLFNSCEDGKFTVDEAEQLEALIVKFAELGE